MVAVIILILFQIQLIRSHTGVYQPYAEITEEIAIRFNKACIKIIHERPMSATCEQELHHWVKYQQGDWLRPYAVITLAEEAFTKRPMQFTCFRAMNTLMADQKMSAEFAKLTWRKRIDKSLWLVFLNSSIQEFFAPASLPFSLELLVVNLQPDGLALIYDVYRVADSQPVKKNYIGNWSKSSGLQIDNRTLYNRRSNLDQIPLRVGMIQNWPATYETEVDGQMVWEGFYPSVWSEIEKAINATSIPTKWVNKSVDLTTGSHKKDGSWSGLIGMSLRGELDVIVSELTVNSRRSDVLDFSRPLLKSKYQIYFKQPGLMLDWSAVLKPFPTALWQAIVVWGMVTSVSLAFCNLVSHRLGIEKDGDRFRWGNSIFFTLQTLAQQGKGDSPKSMACRILFFTSYLVSSVLYPCYSASLISSLTQKTPNRPFDSVHEMLRDNTYTLLVPNNTAEQDYFTDSMDEVLSNVYKQLVKIVPATNMIGQSLDSICRERGIALFGIQEIINQRIIQRSNLDCDIITLTKGFATIHMAMAMPRNHPLSPLVNFHLQRNIENGSVRRTFLKEWPAKKPRTLERWSEVEPVEVFQMFAILGIGALLSSLILVGELFLHRRQIQTKKLRSVNVLYPAYFN